MSGLKNFLSNLSPAQGTFLVFVSLGTVVAILEGSGVANRPPVPNLGFLLLSITSFTLLGFLFGGIAWVVDTLFLWRRSLTGHSLVERDHAVEALRERYARGELDETQFYLMLRRLKAV